MLSFPKTESSIVPRFSFFRFPLLFFGNRVISARAKRVAAEHAPTGKRKTDEKSSFCKRFESVGRAGRCKPARRVSFKRRYEFSVKADKGYADVLHFSVSASFFVSDLVFTSSSPGASLRLSSSPIFASA